MANISFGMAAGLVVAEYDSFAEVYSRSMARDFTRRFLPVVETLLLRELRQHSRVLDVCCGSGEMAHALTDRGFDVSGVDFSASMIALAQENAPDARFVRGDVRALGDSSEVLEWSPFDAAISTFNSFAHLANQRDLVNAFGAIRPLLLPGSPFLFDLSTERSYADRWKGSFSVIEEECVCIVQPSWYEQERLGRNAITLFHRSSAGRDLWQRIDFEIEQKCHRVEAVVACLEESGFGEVQVFDAEADLNMAGERGRAVFLCRSSDT